MSRLIVKNLPKNITEEKIRDLFSQKGEITDIQLKYTAAGKFRQFCFIGYKTEKEADDALVFFNKTCINTSIIKIEKCATLGDATKPKSWSKYAPDSSAYKKDHPEQNEVKPTENIVHEPKKENKIRQLLEKYKDDPMFEDFMQLHGAGDINTILNKLDLNVKKDDNEEEAEKTEEENDSGNESTHSDEEKAANKKISDLEYMKLLMKQNLGKKSAHREKKPKEKIKLYTIKLKGLPYTCTRPMIKEFFNPLKTYTIRLPPKVKGFAYVGFKTEKHMKQALHKDKSFIEGRQIAVLPYSEIKDKQGDTQSEYPKNLKWISQEEALKNEEDIAESGRIFLRNLSYTAVEDDVEKLFSQFGPITEVNLPIDKITRKPKGFGIITFLMPEHAVKAYTELDGSIFQGRMLHLLPGKTKDTIDDLFNTDGLNYKQKKSMKDKATAGSSHNWNTLFIGQNAVADVIADTYGATKEAVVDGRGEGSAAVRLALGETQLVAEIKKFFHDNGIHLEAFNQPAKQRSKTIFLVKNLPAQTKVEEIRSLFEPFGVLGRVILLPNGITGLVEFLEPSEAREAFTNLAYTRFKDVPLYLEWAPENTFKTPTEPKHKIDEHDLKVEKDTAAENDIETERETKKSKKKNKDKDKIKEEKQMIVPESTVQVEADDVDESEEEAEPDTTLYVKNINFTTGDEDLRKHFEQCGKVHYAMIATKKDAQHPGRKLSMGYGFVRFQYKSDANKALKNLQQSVLDGKSLELKRSERTFQNEVKTIKKTAKNMKQISAKILVRNIPFQANAKEIDELFKAFGEIKTIRLPRKLTLGAEQHRGFCFVEYVTKSDAKRAFESLSQSTHLYGRRLVLEWAKSEEDVEQLRKRTADHFHKSEESRSKKSVMDVDSVIGSTYEFV